jgi:hypothetical protein
MQRILIQVTPQQRSNLLILINNSPIKGCDAETVAMLKKLVQSAGASPPPSVPACTSSPEQRNRPSET